MRRRIAHLRGVALAPGKDLSLLTRVGIGCVGGDSNRSGRHRDDDGCQRVRSAILTESGSQVGSWLAVMLRLRRARNRVSRNGQYRSGTEAIKLPGDQRIPLRGDGTRGGVQSPRGFEPVFCSVAGCLVRSSWRVRDTTRHCQREGPRAEKPDAQRRRQSVCPSPIPDRYHL
jgi:hypothetical protein